jgi:hypothetical protein
VRTRQNGSDNVLHTGGPTAALVGRSTKGGDLGPQWGEGGPLQPTKAIYLDLVKVRVWQTPVPPFASDPATGQMRWSARKNANYWRRLANNFW